MAGGRVATLCAVLLLAAACGSRAPGAGVPPGASAPLTAPASEAPQRTPPPSPTVLPSATAAPADEAAIRGRAKDALAALRAKDLARFASFVHPAKGVRFTPYTFVQPGKDVVLSRAAVAKGLADPQRYLWGYTDGKGDPMDWTLGEFFERHLWTRDYAAAPVTLFDHYPEVRGNKFDNTQKAYPGGHTVEQYFPARPNTLDWSGLRLVFERDGGEWYVVGAIHDEWTI
ncbi:MAG TPA: hypothetical protein VFM93_02310 [Candidatus Limnocylindria bacterium]|nr:hypothetical protein [Candidatus Limnocylindria bacterium]